MLQLYLSFLLLIVLDLVLQLFLKL